ncbi:hypothetical protein B9Z55_025211 [Caenorhabditis nigoni]|uniref:F-box associated domain-containing protein n=1 Tax=Caenorhabditis nigoni TaxID=1611254 RepID=A0A2G5SXQ0_9PELO|nr:hypothetical protein B9Z55_025211 [Caenorhabditis nigoni]
MSLLSETLEDAWINSAAIIDCVHYETTAKIQCQTDQGLLEKVIKIQGQIDENETSRVKNIVVDDVNYDITPEKFYPDFDTIEEAKLFGQDEFGNICLTFLTRRFGAMKNVTILMEAIITCQSGHRFKMKFNSGFFFASLTTGIVDSGHGLFERNRRNMMEMETSRTMMMTRQQNSVYIESQWVSRLHLLNFSQKSAIFLNSSLTTDDIISFVEQWLYSDNITTHAVVIELQKQENANVILDYFRWRRYGAIRVQKYFLFPELEKYHQHKSHLLDCPSGSVQVIDLVRGYGEELICTIKVHKNYFCFYVWHERFPTDWFSCGSE